MKIGIAGSGMVGSTSAFALVTWAARLFSWIALAPAEADDILNAIPFAPSALRPGETRLQVLQRNVPGFEQVVAFSLATRGRRDRGRRLRPR
jgi:hypothetical protein